VRLTVRRVAAIAGRTGIAFVVFATAWVVLSWLASNGLLKIGAAAGAILTGTWLALRGLRLAARQAVWRLRNRLMVTYLFIAVAPIAMVVMLALLGGYSLVYQLAAYLVTSQLERRTAILESAADAVAHLAPEIRTTEMPSVLGALADDFPGLEALLRQTGQRFRYPAGSTMPDPPLGWESTGAVVRRAGRYYLWSHRVLPNRAELTLTVPLTRQFLAGLAPNMGRVDIGDTPERLGAAGGLRGALPPPVNRFDREVVWFANRPAGDWDTPGVSSNSLIAVRTRVSAVLSAVFNNTGDEAQGALKVAIVLGMVIFVIVEIACGVIGVTMTRTITSAVHRLYEGTQRVLEGDFSHRIEVPKSGDDQLAELSHSFNRMTAHVEQLLVVAKEKERLESEIEIARQVQNQLFPRATPETQGLCLTAFCQPARMVSGDYYDYAAAGPGRIAIAIGDVAGKGISAALLMAALQSSLRAQLQASLEQVSVEAVRAAANSGLSFDAGAAVCVSTARVVARINRQLHEATPPEKYATFFLGIYEEASGDLTYTNAGHLPPLLLRRGGAQEELDVTGTVVGLFPSIEYGEARVRLESGDMLVCFTDGATESENAFGEMFGEQRLVETIAANANRSEEDMIQAALSAVREWTGAGELADDFTVLLARRV
jgi:sigma-B regulation protein RsbU (phosphoserine phosphatase)